MRIKKRLLNYIFQILGIDTLKAEVAGLRAQVSALAGMVSAASNECAELREFVTDQYRAASNELTEVEQRMMMRIAQIEEIRFEEAQKKSEDEKPAQPAGGFTRWTDRMKKAEASGYDPSKYLKPKKQTEKKPEETTNANI